jgi:hypothetical protein
MGEQSAARLEGDRYQHLYSWYELLQLLDEESPYAYGVVEHPQAGAADDLTLHAKAASGRASKFVQIKWHVDHREAYSFDSIAQITSGTRSLLHKLFDSWRILRAVGPVEVWLVSNWASSPELGQFIDGREYRLSEEFFKCSPRTKGGKAREQWRTVLGADERELNEFCQALRLRLGFGSITDLEQKVDDRMARFGLRIGANPRAIAIDEVSTWIELGREQKQITQQDLLEAIQRRDLHANSLKAPFVSLWIHGWAKRSYDGRPSIELDWTDHFDRLTRRFPDQRTWNEVLHPALIRAREELAALPGGTSIDFRGKLPLTTVLAIGATFPEVGGYSFRAEQPTQGKIYLWQSNATPSSHSFKVKKKQGTRGKDLLIALCITGAAWEEVELFYKESGIFNSVIYAEPNNGTGDASLKSDTDAVALAINAKNLIRKYRQEYLALNIHLIVYGPATFCLFLGQRLNALGKLTGYERTADGRYQASITLMTG